MAILVLTEAKGFGRCTCCGETWRTCEKYIQVYTEGKQGWKKVRGERYCKGCQRYAAINNDLAEDAEVHCLLPAWSDTAEDYDDEAGLRRAEEYAAYQYAGATEHFWSDADAGYVDGFPQYRGRRR